MPRIANIAAKAAIFCTIAFMLLILYQNIEVVIESESYGVFGWLGAVTAVFGILILFTNFVSSEKIYIILILAASLFCRLCFALLVQTPIDGDFLLIYNAAKDVIAGNKSWLEKPFFSNWGYLVPYVYYEALILKLFGSDFALKLLNIAFMVATNMLVYLVSRKLTSPRNAFIAALFYAVYPAPVLLSTVLTNQHISLMFFMLSVYFYIDADSSRNHALLSGLFLFLGNLMRPEAIVIIAAMVIHTLVKTAGNPEWIHIKNKLSGTLTVLAVFTVLTGLSAALFRVTGAAPHGISNNRPEWKFVLGLDTDSKGVYNEEYAYILSISDSELREKEAEKIISESLRKCNSISLFFLEKSKTMWANMETDSWSLRHIQKDRPVWEQYPDFTYKKVIDNIIYFDKAVYILLHILTIIGCIILLITPVSRRHGEFFFVILLLVNYTVYLFIEIQTRYRYFIMPFFFILAASALKEKQGKEEPPVSISGQDNSNIPVYN